MKRRLCLDCSNVESADAADVRHELSVQVGLSHVKHSVFQLGQIARSSVVGTKQAKYNSFV